MTVVAELLIRIKKKSDGDSALTCSRADGSSTWQRLEGRQGRFFPLHDFTHYAVETELKHRRGFYGLVADGWNLEDFGSSGPRGPLPEDMDPSEYIVGLLDLERTQGGRRTVSDLLAEAEDTPSLAAAVMARVGEAELDAIRARCTELIALWDALPVGGALELPFDRGSW